MFYRAICLKDQEDGYEGKLFQIRHFQSITDAYKWLQPAREDQERERWHLRLLWSVIEDFKVYENDIQEIGYNAPQNPEETQLTRLFIQKVEYMDSPLPIL